MEHWIDEMFTTELLVQAAKRFGADATNAIKRGDFENYVYEVRKEDRPYMLRMTHSTHRSKEQVLAELEWVNDLHARGLHVSKNHISLQGELVEEIPLQNGTFFVCLFDKAPGVSAYELKDEFTSEHIEAWGEITAKFHLAASEYKVLNGTRHAWHEDNLIEIEKWIDVQADKALVHLNKKVVQELRNLPTTQDVYGIIHSDIHQGNFFIHGKELHVFDFDDTMYFHYIHDVSIPLYYTVWAKYRNEPLEVRTEKGMEFFHHFLRGYTRIRPLEKAWLERIPLYLTLRDLTLYAVFHQKVDFEKEPEIIPLVEALRNRLLVNEPIVDLDLSKMDDVVLK